MKRCRVLRVAVLATAADEVQPRVGIVESSVCGECLHDVVLGLVGRESADEQPCHLGVAGRKRRRFDVKGGQIEEDRDDGRARESGVDQVVFVVRGVGDAELRPYSQLVELASAPHDPVRGDRLPSGDVTHRGEVVVVHDDGFVAREYCVGHGGSDGHLVDDDVGAAARASRRRCAPRSDQLGSMSAVNISDV